MTWEAISSSRRRSRCAAHAPTRATTATPPVEPTARTGPDSRATVASTVASASPTPLSGRGAGNPSRVAARATGDEAAERSMPSWATDPAAARAVSTSIPAGSGAVHCRTTSCSTDCAVPSSRSRGTSTAA
ncbi:unannotated protein [freshwater metagenome]|uniref:Unannotated protein n=1 Tax=freshwater metagenome TaxID=449393 RepID=A0A6J7IQL0_9ZZZZ